MKRKDRKFPVQQNFKIVRNLRMITINRDDFERLRKAKLIKDGKNDKNYRITSAKKKSDRKKYYVVESRPILIFLGLTK